MPEASTGSAAPLAVWIDRPAGNGIDVLDRGLHYGDGLFETMALRDGEIQLWERHLRRLGRGCERLGMPPPDGWMLLAKAKALCADHAQAVVKVILTRGPGPRGYRIDRSGSDRSGAPPRMTQMVLLYPVPRYALASWRDGVAVHPCATRLAINPALAGIKHLNRLEQVLARDEWDDEDIAEGLMLDTQGRVVAGTASNVFAVSGGRLLTPPVTECGVEGIMRDMVLETAALRGLESTQPELRMEDLVAADEVFLSNSLFGIWPVRRIGPDRLAAGPIARSMMEALGRFSLMPGQDAR